MDHNFVVNSRDGKQVKPKPNFYFINLFKGGFMKLFIGILTLFALVGYSIAGTIAGRVTSKQSGEPLVGANVYLKGTTVGAATDSDGMYYIKIEDGEYQLVVDYVGFGVQQVQINLTGEVKQDFALTEYLFSQSINVIADRAKERETPVAYSNVEKEAMEVSLGSRDIPLIMNTTPSVYSTQQGGGAGDARINVRGFNQRNVAIMINGVPVNDMENGWVYWSNWDGVGDATASIQMQRGLSAVNLATPSIGGTMNIITDPTGQDAGFMFKQEYGAGNFLKSTLFGSTGLIDGKYAVNAGVVRKIGDGHIDKTWTDAWAYYLGASYNISDNQRIELYAVGAPQRHGQNLYKQNIAAYDSAYAKGLDGYDPAAAQAYKQSKDGRFYNQNWSPVSSSYKGKQAVGSETFDRYDSNFLNERENFYHKPQVNLNHYINFSDNMGLATVAYYSGGTGGGTGTYGSMKWNYHVGIESPSRFVAWDETIENNKNSDSGSEGILRNSRNDQYTFGAISKLNWKVMENLKTTFGIDWRTAQVDHYREVRDLLGGEYYLRYDSDFWGDDGKKLKLGDKFDYNYTNNIDWIGGFAQTEYTIDQWTAYGTIGYSQIKYDYTNHFKDDGAGDAFYLEADWISGFQFKGGALYRLAPNMEVYANAGYVSKVPIFDAVINDRTGELVDNEGNEIFTSFEIGSSTQLLDGQLTLKGNYYYTLWENRTVTKSDYDQLSDDEGILVITGMDAKHAGLEFEVAYQPFNMLRFDAAASFGDWTNTNDADALYKDYGSGSDSSFTIYVKDLYTGDAPQTQIALAASVFPVKGLMLQGVYKYYATHYADWNAVDRTDATDRTQSWKTPNYGLLDFHASYKLPFDVSGVSFKVFAHIFNVLDEIYVQDALDNSQYNGFDGDHDADDAEVFLGLPRYFNIGLTVEM